MSVGGFVKVAGKAVAFAKNNPKLVAEAIKIAGDAAKIGNEQKKISNEEKIVALQIEIESMKEEIVSLKESAKSNKKWSYICIGIGLVSIIISVLVMCL